MIFLILQEKTDFDDKLKDLKMLLKMLLHIKQNVLAESELNQKKLK